MAEEDNDNIFLFDDIISTIPSQLPPRKYFPNGDASPDEWTKKIIPHLNKSKCHSDFTLISADEERLPVHRDHLILRSEGLSDAIERLPFGVKELRLPFTSAILKHLIHFLYHDNLKKNIREEEIIGLLEFESKYKTFSLQRRCVKSFKKKITIDVAGKLYKTALQYGLHELVETAFDFMTQNAQKFFSTDDFLLLDDKELNNFIMSDKLCAPEIDVFKAVINWGTSVYTKILESKGETRRPTRENVQAALATTQTRLLIRYGLLSAEELAMVVAPSGLLSDSELVSVFSYISLPENAKNPFRTLYRNRSRVYQKQNNDTNTSHQTREDHPTSSSSRVFQPHHQVSMLGQEVPEQPHPMSIKAVQTIDSPARNRNGFSSLLPEPEWQNRPVFDDNGNSSDLPRNAGGRRNLSSLDIFNSIAQTKNYYQHNVQFRSWDDFVAELSSTSESDRQITTSVKLDNVELGIANYHTSIHMPSLREVYLDLTIRDICGSSTSAKELREIFESVFDIRQFLCFKSDKDRNWKLKDLWDSKIPIKLTINGITFLKIDKIGKELIIAFRNNSQDILAGLGKGDHLLKLNLMKTEVPRFEGFPCKYLEEVVFYHAWSIFEPDVANFVKRCTSLKKFSCWVMRWESSGNQTTLISPVELNLHKDFTSGDELEHLALYEVVVVLPLPPLKPVVKAGVTNLILDSCFWPESFEDSFHTIFPNLRRVAIKQKNNNHSTLHEYKSTVTVRMLNNIIQLPHIEFIRIWGVDWEERYSGEGQGKQTKNLRSRISAVRNEEIVKVQSILEGCGLQKCARNFMLELDHETKLFAGVEFNDQEPKEDDFGFWDQMDRLDYDYYLLGSFFKDYKVMQNNFDIHFGLPH